MPSSRFSSSSLCAAVSLVIVLASVVRIVATYPHTAQAFDEPCHVSAGIEFLDRGTYTLDAVHPPLARIAIATPLYVAGERYPQLPPNDPASSNYNVVGNHILYDSGHLLRNLTLARLGVLPFFMLGALIVYLWTKQIAGDIPALIAVFLYVTTPTVLAFSSIAYTDIVAASTQLAAMFIFSLWLETPDRVRTIWLGLAIGMAFLAKLTSLLFLPAAAIAIVLVWFAGNRHQGARQNFAFGKLLAAGALAAVLVWAGYGFSFRPLHEATGITAASMPSFQHFPGPVRNVARSLVLRDPRLPAPELLHGIALAWSLNGTPAQSYLLGHIKYGGWWYFYLVALGVKLPLPLLVLFVVSIVLLIKYERDAKIFFPLAALAAILLITTRVNYQVGVRHILVAFPLIAMVAALGVRTMLEQFRWRSIAFALLAAFLGWQAVESARAQSDFLAYFNESAGSDPSKVLVTGCDLDCGQDLFRLADELHSRHITACTLAIWSSADIDRSNLPHNDPVDAAAHFHGCVALSARALRIGDVLHQTYGPDEFSALEHYRPTAIVGRTIRLYDIPSDEATRK